MVNTPILVDVLLWYSADGREECIVRWRRVEWPGESTFRRFLGEVGRDTVGIFVRGLEVVAVPGGGTVAGKADACAGYDIGYGELDRGAIGM